MYQATGGFESIVSVVKATSAVAGDPHLPEVLCLLDRLASKAPGVPIDITDVAKDPHLLEVVCQILRLKALEEGKVLPPCAEIPKNRLPGVGIGLRHVTGPLRFFVQVKENPMLGVALGVGVIGGLVGIGYLIGKAR